MPHDPQRVADTRAWLRRAQGDLRAAEIDLAAQPALLGDAAFHCQQATEKSLKAFLTWHDQPFRRTHDLAELGQECVSLDVSLESVCRRAEALTTYAWVFRYPGDVEEPTPEEVEETLALAQEVHEAVVARVSSEVRA
jgi:HEPN domain-containing protein